MSIIDLLKKNQPTVAQGRETVRRLQEEQTFAVAELAEAEAMLSKLSAVSGDNYARTS